MIVKYSINTVIFTTLLIFITAYSKIALSADSASVLVVNAGETHTINATKGFLEYERLVLHSNATLVIDTSLQQVVLVANNVEIGDNTKLIAVGSHGEASISPAISEPVQACKKPVDGVQGNLGNDGGNGVNLSLNWAITSFGSIEIDTRGGNGGQGGNGGNGSNVPPEKSCKDTRGGHGGAGGDGGNGGNGGDAGNIFFSYTQQGRAFDVANNIKTLTNGGKSGIGGIGGAGGNGSQGYYISKRTLAGSKKWVAGGESGINGLNGRNGSDGNRGIVSIKLDASSLGTASKATDISDSKASQSRIERLEDQVSELFKRIKELEAKIK